MSINFIPSSKVILAPMSGISALPYRAINRSFGCECAFTEMINARALCYKSVKSSEKLIAGDDDRPLGIQLVGREEKYLIAALEAFDHTSFDFLDLNAACPENKVTKKGEGAGLLQDIPTLARLIGRLKKYTTLPVTVKIRLGWSDTSQAVAIARACQDAGAAALFVHGRTCAQRYRSPVHYEVLEEVKKSITIPMIASGDIFDGPTAKKMFERSGCEAVLVARGALGNPWIFPEIKAALTGVGAFAKPTGTEAAGVMREHFRLTREFYGEHLGPIVFRKFYLWYLRGFSRIKDLKDKVVRAKTEVDVYGCIDEFEARTGEFKRK